jgi:hypothetical protein
MRRFTDIMKLMTSSEYLHDYRRSGSRIFLATITAQQAKKVFRLKRGKPLPPMRHHVNIRNHIAEVIT